MNWSINLDGGYLLIGGLTLVGLLLIFLSLVINSHVAHNVRADLRHREKLLEYYRNTFSQAARLPRGLRARSLRPMPPRSSSSRSTSMPASSSI